MAETDIFSQATQDLADVFRIVAERGEKLSSAGIVWHSLGNVSTADHNNYRILTTPEGTVKEPKTEYALLEFRDEMSMKKLHDLAEKLRAQLKP